MNVIPSREYQEQNGGDLAITQVARKRTKPPGQAIMDTAARAAALKSLSGSKRIVLVYLAQVSVHAVAQLTSRTIASDLGLSLRTVERGLVDLRSSGWITVDDDTTSPKGQRYRILTKKLGRERSEIAAGILLFIPTLKAREREFLVELLKHPCSDGPGFIRSKPKLAKSLGIGSSTARSYAATLVERGFLVEVRKCYYKIGSGKHRDATRYLPVYDLAPDLAEACDVSRQIWRGYSTAPDLAVASAFSNEGTSVQQTEVVSHPCGEGPTHSQSADVGAQLADGHRPNLQANLPPKIQQPHASAQQPAPALSLSAERGYTGPLDLDGSAAGPSRSVSLNTQAESLEATEVGQPVIEVSEVDAEETEAELPDLDGSAAGKNRSKAERLAEQIASNDQRDDDGTPEEREAWDQFRLEHWRRGIPMEKIRKMARAAGLYVPPFREPKRQSRGARQANTQDAPRPGPAPLPASIGTKPTREAEQTDAASDPDWLVAELAAERAAIIEFDGGMSRDEAEALASPSGLARNDSQRDTMLADFW